MVNAALDSDTNETGFGEILVQRQERTAMRDGMLET